MRFVSPLVSVLLASLLVNAPLTAQVSPSPDLTSPSLQLRLLDAEPGSAPAGSVGKSLRVAVTDAAGLPVQNAAVVFRTPESGPSATFKDGTHAEVAYTDANGEAHMGPIQWGIAPGVLPFRITAAKDIRHAGLLLEQTITAAPAPAPVPSQALTVSASAVQNDSASTPKVSSTATRKSIPSVVVEHRNSSALSAEPGTLAAAGPTTPDLDSPDANIPVRNFSGTGGAGIGEAPGVSVLSSGAASSGHHKAKWIILIGAAAGAGAALAFVHKGRSSSTSSAASGIIIGSPSISVGHP